MSPAEFEPTIPATQGPQTHSLDRAATGIDMKNEVLGFKHVLQKRHVDHLGTETGTPL
jgi:hypothetical protein